MPRHRGIQTQQETPPHADALRHAFNDFSIEYLLHHGKWLAGEENNDINPIVKNRYKQCPMQTIDYHFCGK